MRVTGSPLVPEPELPWNGSGLGISVRPSGSQVYIYSLDSMIILEREDVTPLAAAVLVAADLEDHRVIDLGGPLPEARRMDDQIWAGESDPHDVGTDYRASCLEIIRSELAVIEAYPHAHHDPAEVEAIAVALATHAGQANDIDPWREDARVALDTIAALRGRP